MKVGANSLEMGIGPFWKVKNKGLQGAQAKIQKWDGPICIGTELCLRARKAFAGGDPLFRPEKIKFDCAPISKYHIVRRIRDAR